ncbi:rod shape-determining protein RodA [Seleniivibrio woodruffii]|uniref:Peptidoglycan glycosyltransferase RodA n=1 Tax=Seleniivibrio woodruffii TaxID=1078050 RepID=A0A4R1K8I3_9BACT|nr:rod shape-determining protein RodA [Seleniivibrio woodruffii]TCK60658.1 cell elongation-specific peptidoglycan biosynthesis regulator RodA [Seleniivibrio woodruffii]TVZ36288.1 cell elongation-specific peptidoglycan biosynthesis regulator RodA [Seleniivibrio woodruffii]
MLSVKLDRKHIENFDVVLLVLLFIITTMGIFAIYSAGFDPVDGKVRTFYLKQFYFLILGYVLFFGFSAIGYKRLVKYSYVLYFFGILILVAVLLMGHEGKGAVRWISVAGIRIQPSEFFKFIWVIVLARLYIDFTMNKYGMLDIIKKLFMSMPPFLLVFLQPDLGTGGTYLAVWGIVLLFIGIKRVTLMIILASLVFAAPLLWTHMKPYQKQRVETFLNPEADPFGSGYHVIQSKIAIGSGGLFGKGFMNGTQSHLKFIPERHTDFIFAVIAEEFGFVGGCVVILIFSGLVFRIIYIGVNSKESAGKLVCVAAASLFFFQFFVNMAMTVGMMPVVGIPMPMVSYGGSSLVTFMAILGIVNSVAMRRFDSPSEE